MDNFKWGSIYSSWIEEKPGLKICEIVASREIELE